MKLVKEDLIRIGHAVYPFNGFLCIVCRSETADVEYLMAREILSLWGAKITKERDFVLQLDGDEEGNTDVELVTNLPWTTYRRAFHKTVELS